MYGADLRQALPGVWRLTSVQSARPTTGAQHHQRPKLRSHRLLQRRMAIQVPHLGVEREPAHIRENHRTVRIVAVCPAALEPSTHELYECTSYAFLRLCRGFRRPAVKALPRFDSYFAARHLFAQERLYRR